VPVLTNARHEHFAQLVAGGKTPPAAYVLAGYSEAGATQSANRLLKKADVLLRVEELRKSVEEPARERAIEKAAVDKAWVLSELIEVVKMAKQAEPVYDNDGNPIGEYKQNLAAGNKALELIGKELGMFVDRKEIRTGALEEADTETLMEMRRQIEARKRVDVRVH
jgi:phage terminase small subunit